MLMCLVFVRTTFVHLSLVLLRLYCLDDPYFFDGVALYSKKFLCPQGVWDILAISYGFGFCCTCCVQTLLFTLAHNCSSFHCDHAAGVASEVCVYCKRCTHEHVHALRVKTLSIVWCRYFSTLPNLSLSCCMHPSTCVVKKAMGQLYV